MFIVDREKRWLGWALVYSGRIPDGSVEQKTGQKICQGGKQYHRGKIPVDGDHHGHHRPKYSGESVCAPGPADPRTVGFPQMLDSHRKEDPHDESGNKNENKGYGKPQEQREMNEYLNDIEEGQGVDTQEENEIKR